MISSQQRLGSEEPATKEKAKEIKRIKAPRQGVHLRSTMKKTSQQNPSVKSDTLERNAHAHVDRRAEETDFE